MLEFEQCSANLFAMSTTEAILEKLSVLSPEKQKQVLQYVQTLAAPSRPVEKSPDPHAWLKVAMSMNLDGPPDWSERFEDYLNGQKHQP